MGEMGECQLCGCVFQLWGSQLALNMATVKSRLKDSWEGRFFPSSDTIFNFFGPAGVCVKFIAQGTALRAF